MLPTWRMNALELLKDTPGASIIGPTFVSLLRVIHHTDWRGACHASSAVLCVALAEQGVASTLCLGEAALGHRAFDHSWLEIHGEIYDAAISCPLDRRFAAPPTVRGFDAETKRACAVQYGVVSGLEPDPSAAAVRAMPFGTFMTGEMNLWVTVVGLLRKVGVAAEEPALRERFAESTAWMRR